MLFGNMNKKNSFLISSWVNLICNRAERCCEVAHFYLIMELVGFNKTSPAAKLKTTFYFLVANHFLLGYVETCFSTLYKSKKEKCIKVYFMYLLYFYMQHNEIILSAGNISSIHNSNSFLIRIWFTCNISLQKI